MTTKQQERQDAIEQLRTLCPPGTTVYTILRSVSRSGMRRIISPVIIKDNEVYHLTGLVADVLGRSTKDGGIVENGAGMDMGFHLVYSLSRALYAQSNLARPDRDGGYSLNQRWL